MGTPDSALRPGCRLDSSTSIWNWEVSHSIFVIWSYILVVEDLYWLHKELDCVNYTLLVNKLEQSWADWIGFDRIWLEDTRRLRKVKSLMCGVPHESFLRPLPLAFDLKICHMQYLLSSSNLHASRYRGDHWGGYNYGVPELFLRGSAIVWEEFFAKCKQNRTH